MGGLRAQSGRKIFDHHAHFTGRFELRAHILFYTRPARYMDRVYASCTPTGLAHKR